MNDPEAAPVVFPDRDQFGDYTAFMLAYREALALHAARLKAPPNRSRRQRALVKAVKRPSTGQPFKPHNAVGLTYADRLAILWLHREGANRQHLAQTFGISTAMLHRIVRHEAARLGPGPVRKTL